MHISCKPKGVRLASLVINTVQKSGPPWRGCETAEASGCVVFLLHLGIWHTRGQVTEAVKYGQFLWTRAAQDLCAWVEVRWQRGERVPQR